MFWDYRIFIDMVVFSYNFNFYYDFFIFDLSIKVLYITNSTYSGCFRPYSSPCGFHNVRNILVCLLVNGIEVDFNLSSLIFYSVVMSYSYSYNRYYIYSIRRVNFLSIGSNFFNYSFFLDSFENIYTNHLYVNI